MLSCFALLCLALFVCFANMLLVFVVQVIIDTPQSLHQQVQEHQQHRLRQFYTALEHGETMDNKASSVYGEYPVHRNVQVRNSSPVAGADKAPIYTLQSTPIDLKASQIGPTGTHNGQLLPGRKINEAQSITASRGIVKLLGSGEFKYILEAKHVCSNRTEDTTRIRGPFLLMLVHSHGANREQRHAVRDTWGRLALDPESSGVRLVFVLGNAVDPRDMAGVYHESRLFRDIVLVDFVDSYRNLSLKSLAGLTWAQKFCPGAEYVLKTDDDVYLNITNLLKYLRSEERPRKSIAGALCTGAKVQRRGLWRVDRTLYENDTYPPYCTGAAYVMTQSVAGQLLSSAWTGLRTLIPIEDAYITGILAKQVGVSCVNHPKFPQWYIRPSTQNMAALLQGQLFGLHNVRFEQMYAIYKTIKLKHCPRCADKNRAFLSFN